MGFEARLSRLASAAVTELVPVNDAASVFRQNQADRTSCLISYKDIHKQFIEHPLFQALVSVITHPELQSALEYLGNHWTKDVPEFSGLFRRKVSGSRNVPVKYGIWKIFPELTLEDVKYKKTPVYRTEWLGGVRSGAVTETLSHYEKRSRQVVSGLSESEISSVMLTALQRGGRVIVSDQERQDHVPQEREGSHYIMLSVIVNEFGQVVVRDSIQQLNSTHGFPLEDWLDNLGHLVLAAQRDGNLNQIGYISPQPAPEPPSVS